ncbi:hypothetical protein [Mesorhizobium tamadayense]|uniref:hypothetical protein n=1 Tax=Mesorhizobium tamadayense TaxID=425306 RepID=UPI00142DDC1B|nr:hypothetical protein [Mesorhizobium tamadayense]
MITGGSFLCVSATSRPRIELIAAPFSSQNRVFCFPKGKPIQGEIHIAKQLE